MLSQDTADCLVPANTAILMRPIEELIKGHAIANPHGLFRDAVAAPENCQRSSRVEDAIRLITKELMPRIARAN